MKDVVLYASLVTGLISAVFWAISALSTVKEGPETQNEIGMTDHRQIIDGADVKLTMRKQAKWNSRAALAAALTAVLQVIYNVPLAAIC